MPIFFEHHDILSAFSKYGCDGVNNPKLETRSNKEFEFRVRVLSIRYYSRGPRDGTRQG